MKINFRSLTFRIICGATVFLSPLVAHAQINRLYIKADVGGNLTPDTTLKEFFGEPLTAGSKVKFDPGVRFGIAAGYQITDWFAPEVESGFMANSIK